jgi:hypothetical protein
LLKDIDELRVVNQKYSIDDKFPLIHADGDTLYINTWYNADRNTSHFKGISLATLYENFTKVYKFLNIKLEPIEFYIPTIDFTKYEISHIDEFMMGKQDKVKVFISNGKVQSNQSVNYNMDELIRALASNHIDVLFFISNGCSIVKDNVFQTNRIIRLKDNDLCENAYISTFCDIIFGRNSGSHTYSFLKDNVITDNIQTHINNAELSLLNYFPNLWNSNKKVIDTVAYNNIINIIDQEVSIFKNKLL